jgi:hypothetical protein
MYVYQPTCTLSSAAEWLVEPISHALNIFFLQTNHHTMHSTYNTKLSAERYL